MQVSRNGNKIQGRKQGILYWTPGTRDTFASPNSLDHHWAALENPSTYPTRCVFSKNYPCKLFYEVCGDSIPGAPIMKHNCNKPIPCMPLRCLPRYSWYLRLASSSNVCQLCPRLLLACQRQLKRFRSSIGHENMWCTNRLLPSQVTEAPPP